MQEKQIEGWRVLIQGTFSPEETRLLPRAEALLAVQLKTICQRVPAGPLAELRKVTLWISGKYPNVPERAEYHPSADWLRENGRNPAMARGIELTNVRLCEQESRRMPLFVLHELAHAYHDRVLTNHDPRLIAAFESAQRGGKYEDVLRQDADGRRRRARAYALTNVQEYFAEGTEAFFGANDFYPFNRAELKKHDPMLHDLLAEIWR